MVVKELTDEQQLTLNGPHQCVPIYKDAMTGNWVLTRYDDCQRVLQDRNFIPANIKPGLVLLAERSGHSLQHLCTMSDMFLPALGGDHHRWLRALLARTISKGPSVAELGRSARAHAESLWMQGVRTGELDVVQDYAEPLVAALTSQLFGFDNEIAHALEGLGGIISIYNFGCSLTTLRHYEGRLERLVDPALAFLAREHRDRPTGPIGTFAQGLIDAGSTDTESAMAFAALFLISSEQTASDIALCIRALVTDDAAMAAWAAPRLDRMRAVNELVRVTTPVARLLRICPAQMELGGVVMEKGDLVSVMIGAANRDASVFADPDRIVLDRPTTHLGFAAGLHICIGKQIALAKLTAALEPIGRHPPAWVMTHDVIWSKFDLLRRMTSFRVAF